jgi:hypothetical protein
MTRTAAADLPRRYPGLKPFERSQSAVFHGRRDDVQRLSNLVLRERLVVLFAKSGIGKTSLLQAGCAPELERQDFVPVFLRSEKTNQPLLQTVAAVLPKNPQVSGRDTTDERPHERQTLWEQMKRLEFDLNGLPATPVLVFDQFEEVFTLSHSDLSRAQFLNELADLANETMPTALRSELLRRFQAGEINVETMQWWERQPDLRIVLSIRSDFLNLIDGMSARIPGILRNRYQLQPLDREKARTAIVSPAQAEGAYASSMFGYTELALEEMIDFLAGQDSVAKGQGADEALLLKKKDEIEAVNLQIVCQDVEERMIDYQKPAGFEVTPDFYGHRDGLRVSIRNFYDNQLQAFPRAYLERILQKTQQRAPIAEWDKTLTAKPAEVLVAAAQRLIEESLVTSGNRRNSVVDDTLLDEHKVTPDFLDTLVDRRLLRKEPRLDDFYYEISHDTLLPAIIESRNNRREREKANLEKVAYEARFAEEAKRRESVEAELKATRKQRKLARMVALTSFISLLACLAFAVWFVRDYVNATRDQLRSAEQSVSIELYGAGIPNYQELLKHPNRCWVLRHTKPRKDVTTELSAADSLYRAFRVVEDSLAAGDAQFFIDQYPPALRLYRRAHAAQDHYNRLNWACSPLQPDGRRAWRVDSARVAEKFQILGHRIVNTQKAVVREFKISQRDFEVFKEAKVWGQATRNLLKMKQLLPFDRVDMEHLEAELNISDLPAYVEEELKICQAKLRGL